MKVFRTGIYEKKLLKLLREDEAIAKEHEILTDPTKWPVVAGTGGIRKARVAKHGSGKRGGLRVMYYFWVTAQAVYFLDVYAKNEKETLSASDKKMLRQLIDVLKEE